MDLQACFASAIPSGARTPWLIAPFMNNTFPGSMGREIKGRTPARVILVAPPSRVTVTASMKGAGHSIG